MSPNWSPPNTVNTMPEKTIDAVADHGVITGDTITGRAGQSQVVFDKLAALGIDLPDVFRVLEEEGVDKFEKSWLDLLEAAQLQLSTPPRNDLSAEPTSRHIVFADTDSSAYHSLRQRPSTREERFALGKRLRRRVPRRTLAEWVPPQDRPIRSSHRTQPRGQH